MVPAYSHERAKLVATITVTSNGLNTVLKTSVHCTGKGQAVPSAHSVNKSTSTGAHSGHCQLGVICRNSTAALVNVITSRSALTLAVESQRNTIDNTNTNYS
jgi:hypothetical protein